MTSAVAALQTVLERRFDLDRDRGRSRPGSGCWASAAGPARRRCPRPSVSREAEAAWLGSLLGATDETQRGQPFVICRNVQKSYGGREVLPGVDLAIAQGEVVVIMGPSGSGKSTLLRLINHLEALDHGEITVAGQPVGYLPANGGPPRPVRNLARARAEARIGMVFQHFNLFEHLTALENVMEAPVRVYGVPRAEAEATAAAPARRGRALAGMPTTCRTGSPAASSSAWRSPARWRSSRS